MLVVNRCPFAIGLILALACIAGCGSKDGNITGEVTLNGEPVKEGVIRFVPVGGNTPSADARIVDGKFSANVPAGEKRIEITAPNIADDGKMVYEPPANKDTVKSADLIPERYNVKSELTIKVESGKQHKEFKLTSP
jgi:hypothetical protein